MKTERKQMVFAALFAVLATFMVGCSHENGGEIQPVDSNADIISFSSGSHETRTIYSNVITDNKERVDWVAGDVVTIWSDKADDHSDAKKNYADYEAGTPVNEGYTSTAPLTINSGTSLRWNPGDGQYRFWGAYPASKVTVAMSGNNANTEAPSFSASIPQDQDISAHTYTTGEGASATSTVKYEPSMAYAYMASYLKTSRVDKVTLPFEMAFTAFEFTIKAQDMEFVLQSFTLESSTSPVTGKFTATWTSVNEGESEYKPWIYLASNVTTETSKKVTISFNEPPKVSKDDQVTFTVFTLPQEMKDLTASFKIKGENGPSITKTLPLKKNNTFKKYDGCKKHKIGVLAIPTGWKFSEITLNLKAIDWNEIEKSTDDYAQATQFEVTGAESREDDNYPELKQSWYVTKDQPFTVTYKVFLPEGGSWSIIPAGDTDAFSIACTSPTGTPAAQDGSFSGSIASGANGTRVTLKITPTGDAGKTLYFKTYITKGGVTYSIDSETQLFDVAVDSSHPDITRGYHKFTIKQSN